MNRQIVDKLDQFRHKANAVQNPVADKLLQDLCNMLPMSEWQNLNAAYHTLYMTGRGSAELSTLINNLISKYRQHPAAGPKKTLL